MLLKAYLKSRGLTQTAFAAILGLKRQSCVSRYVSGETVPEAFFARKITRLSHGKVTERDFVEQRRLWLAKRAAMKAGS